MRNRIPLLLVLLAASGLPLDAQEQASRSYALNANGALRIMNVTDAGSIRVIGWDKDSVVVSGTLAKGTRLFGGGNRDGVKIFWETEKGTVVKEPGATEIVVRVPARARVWVTAGIADVDVTSIAGQLDVTGVGGHVRVQGTPSEVRAETMNGDVDVAASPAYLRLKTATGHITWTGSSEDAGLTTVSGKIVANGGTLTRARFESIDGDIRFSGTVGKSASVTFDTHGGDVTLILAKDTEAAVEANAPSSDLFGKRVAPGPDITKRFTNYATLGQPGIGGPSIVVRTFKGRVMATLQ